MVGFEQVKSVKEAFVSEASRCLSQFCIEDAQISQKLDRASQTKNRLDIEVMNVTASLFQGARPMLTKSANKINSKVLGTICFSQMPVSRLEVSDLEQMEKIVLKERLPTIVTVHSVFKLAEDDDDFMFVVFYTDSNGRMCYSRSNREGQTDPYGRG